MIAVSASSASVVSQLFLWLCRLHLGPFFQKINLIVREGDVGFVHNPWIECVDFSGFLGLGLG